MEICELLIDDKMFAKDDVGSKALASCLAEYLPPFSLFSSMISPRHAASCANWNISVS